MSRGTSESRVTRADRLVWWTHDPLAARITARNRGSTQCPLACPECRRRIYIPNDLSGQTNEPTYWSTTEAGREANYASRNRSDCRTHRPRSRWRSRLDRLVTESQRPLEAL